MAVSLQHSGRRGKKIFSHASLSYLLPFTVLISIFLTTPVFAQRVYIILSSDTSVWVNTSGGDTADTYANEFDYDIFTNPSGILKQVFGPSFRNAHTDSLGHPFKVSWFMHGGGWFQKGTNSTSISTLFMIKKYWGGDIETWGDELAYHFHHFTWSGSSWVMAPSFADTIWDFEWTMSQMLIEESLYPVSFRSGWNYMDNPYEQYLDRWIPFRLEGEAGMTDSTPYHPSSLDYRKPGDMKGWEVHHYYMKNFTASVANQIFNTAHEGHEQVVCVWSHQNETDFPQQIAGVNAVLHSTSLLYPDVTFLYCSAKEAMQSWLKTTDVTPPTLKLSTVQENHITTVTVEGDADMYSAEPWVAARMYSGTYLRLGTETISDNIWRFTYDAREIDRVVVGATDLYGNTSLAEVHDCSRAWKSQSEFYQAEPENMDLETEVNHALLSPMEIPVAVIEQTEEDGQMEPLRRSYWIGQTFIPKSDGISGVTFGAKVNQPAVFLVELRSMLSDGFPDDNPSGLLTSGTTTLNSSGLAHATLDFTGFQRDGRPYAIIFKILSGNTEIRLSTLNPYTDGTLIRAYSLDWITIPSFDCQFQIFDESQNLSIDQSTYDSDAYVSERGLFLAQTFLTNIKKISGLELHIVESVSGEHLGIQLRTTLPGGAPDFSHAGLLEQGSFTVNGSGILSFPLNWDIPEGAWGKTLALTFVSPIDGQNTIRLAQASGNLYHGGELFISDDLTTIEKMENNDLRFRLFASGYAPSGTLTFTEDAGKVVRWTHAEIVALTNPPETNLRVRFRIANSAEALPFAPWSSFLMPPTVTFAPSSRGRFIQAQVLLESLGEDSPVFNSLEVFYDEILPPGSLAVKNWTNYE